MTLHFGDNSIRHPYGNVQYVLMRVEIFIFEEDFVMLDMLKDDDILLITGRPFLLTHKCMIDLEDGTIT